jgi:hypothetical protein
MAFQIDEATIDGIHAAMRAGEVTSRALVDAYLDRIEAVDRAGPRLNGVLGVSEVGPRPGRRARRGAGPRRRAHGPAARDPVLVKDCVETSDIPTTFGSAAIEGYTPERDAVIVRKLRDAGAVILAKTTLPTSRRRGSRTRRSARRRRTRTRSTTTRRVERGHRLGGRREPRRRRHRHGLRRLHPRAGLLLQPRRRAEHAGVVPRTGSSYLVIFQDTIGR